MQSGCYKYGTSLLGNFTVNKKEEDILRVPVTL